MVMDLMDNKGLDKREQDKRLTAALLKLGQGFVFKEAKDVSVEIWDTLTTDVLSVRAALRPFDLTYAFEDFGNVGYAYLRPLGEEEGGMGLLKVGKANPLLSYILVILRRTYKEFAEQGRNTTAVMTREALNECLNDYAEETTDPDAFKSKVDQELNKLVKLKIIKINNGQIISIHPIIAALVNARWLKEYAEYLEQKKQEVQDEGTRTKGPGKKDMIDEAEDALFDEEDE